MKWFYNLGTTTKLVSAFLLLSAIMAMVGYSGVSGMGKINGMLNTMYERDVRGLIDLQEADAQLSAIAIEIRQTILAKEHAAMQRNGENIEKYKTILSDRLDKFEKTILLAENKAEFARLKADFPPYYDLVQRIFNLAMAERNGEAMKAIAEGKAIREKVTNGMKQFIQRKMKLCEEAYRDSDEVYCGLRKMVVCIIIGGVVISLAVGFFNARIIAKPLRKTLIVLEGVAKGDYTRRLDLDTKDEVGQMASALNTTIAAVEKAMQDVKDAAEREAHAQAEKAAEERRLAEAQRREAEEADRKVRCILEVANRVSQRDYTQQLDVSGKDPLGQLGEGLKAFFDNKRDTEIREAEAAEKDRREAAELRRKVDHLLEVVGAAAQGDLTKDVKVEGKEPVDELAGGIKKMLTDLAQVIRQVTESASQFSEGSRVIAESSQTLAQGAQHQSSSVEEMSAAIEELTHSIQGVKENALDADKVAKRTNQLAERGGKAVQKSIEAMGLIRTSSTQIGEIIQVISEIASQTNLLALNAAIEAARAGEHGMGFAVVADEVRKLAERSNQAAREISTLIKESTQRVEEGVQLSDETEKSLKEILDGVAQTVTKISEIASATVEQSTNAEEVSKSIQGIAQVTEQTAAGSEEMASSSEQLGAQASGLRELVGRFNV